MEQDKGYQPRADADNHNNLKKHCVPGDKSGNEGPGNKESHSRWWEFQEGLATRKCEQEQVDYKPIIVEDPFSFETVINWKKPQLIDLSKVFQRVNFFVKVISIKALNFFENILKQTDSYL